MAGRQGDRFKKPARKYDVGQMEEFAFDDQTTIGHELFENIRHVRQYLRKTKYELPKLSGKNGWTTFDMNSINWLPLPFFL